MHAAAPLPPESSAPPPLDLASAVARVLVGSDGTLTRALAAVAREPIRLLLLDQRLAEACVGRSAAPALDLREDEALLERRVMLEGVHSGTRFLHAHSQVAVDRLSPELREAMLTGREPVGEIFTRLRVETFKEIDELAWEAAGPLAKLLGVPAARAVLLRRYRIFARAVPVMFIEERLPDRW
jgi:chorismate-pyruvate lyase